MGTQLSRGRQRARTGPRTILRAHTRPRTILHAHTALRTLLTTGALVALISTAVLTAALLAPPGAQAALRWSGPVGHDSGGQGAAIAAVACSPPSSCVAADQGGEIVAFDAGHPAYAAPQKLDSQAPTGLACVNAADCVAVDGAGNRITFNPGNPGAANTAAVDQSRAFTAVACVPSSTECVGVDAGGYAVTFDINASGAGTPIAIDTGVKLVGVACVPPGLSRDTCVAIDSADKEIQFTIDTTNQTPTVNSIQTVDASATATLTAIACPSTSQCVAFDNAGQQMSVNPQSPGTPQTTTLDAGHSLVAATCASATRCDAVDNAGRTVDFAPGQTGTIGQVAAQTDLTGISCPGRCVTGDSTGHIHSFAPGGAGAASTLIDNQSAYSAVACPATTQCTGIDNFGDEATFDPTTGAAASVAAVDPDADIVYAVSCPSPVQCTAVDDLGKAATFNPRSPSSPSVTAIVTGHPLLAIACPLADQCTAVDDDRYAATFNPQHPTAAIYTDLNTPVGTSLVGIACPSAGQCTVLDGAGSAVTFDPQAPGHPAPRRVLPGPGIDVACPLLNECVAIDARGNRATFDPQTRSTLHTAAVSRLQPAALACPSATYCTALDTSGNVVEFDPHGTGATDTRPTGDSALVSDLSCPAITRCVTVDYAGNAFTAWQSISGLPSKIAGPSITGHLVVGDLVTARTGRWRNGPTAFQPRWERCNAKGRACRTIASATAQTYRLTRADTAHTLRVAETPSNPLGVGRTVTSGATHRVTGAPAAPAITRTRLVVAPGPARLSFALTAARYGPQLRTLTVTLPAGVSLTLGGPLTLGSGHRTVAGTVRHTRAGFVLSLRRSVRTLAVTLAAPRLNVAGALAGRIRAHRAGRLSLTVAAGRGKALRRTARITLVG